MRREAVLLAALSGCLSGQQRGQALYAGAPRNPEEVAQLTGYVDKVDGKDLSGMGHQFELLPGCHLIVTPSEWGTVGSTGGIIVKTGHLTFALPMKAARQYSVEVQAALVGGAGAKARVVTIEKDMQGNVIKEFGAARSAEDIAACQAAAPSAPAP